MIDIDKMKSLDDFLYITYLIGAMEKTAEGDSGESKREKLFNGLIKRSVFPIDPCRTEVMRTGFTSKELKLKMEGWTASGNKELRKKYSKYIWEGRNIVTEDYNIIYIPGDFHAVKIANWLTAVINEGDAPCGTFGEAGLGTDRKVPIYIITELPKYKLPGSFRQWMDINDGEVFKTESEYFKFIDKKYKLKEKK